MKYVVVATLLSLHPLLMAMARTAVVLPTVKAAVYFFNALRSPVGQNGMNYFKKRELSDETLRLWGLGYADQTRDGLYQYLKNSGFDDEILHESGLITFSEKGVYDKFFNRVMFPIMDANNRVIGF
jgi:DNA primase